MSGHSHFNVKKQVRLELHGKMLGFSNFLCEIKGRARFEWQNVVTSQTFVG